MNLLNDLLCCFAHVTLFMILIHIRLDSQDYIILQKKAAKGKGKYVKVSTSEEVDKTVDRGDIPSPTVIQKFWIRC